MAQAVLLVAVGGRASLPKPPAGQPCSGWHFCSHCWKSKSVSMQRQNAKATREQARTEAKARATKRGQRRGPAAGKVDTTLGLLGDGGQAGNEVLVPVKAKVDDVFEAATAAAAADTAAAADDNDDDDDDDNPFGNSYSDEEREQEAAAAAAAKREAKREAKRDTAGLPARGQGGWRPSKQKQTASKDNARPPERRRAPWELR